MAVLIDKLKFIENELWEIEGEALRKLRCLDVYPGAQKDLKKIQRVRAMVGSLIKTEAQHG